MAKGEKKKIPESVLEERRSKQLYGIFRSIKRLKRRGLRMNCDFGQQIGILRSHAAPLKKMVGVYQGQRIALP